MRIALLGLIFFGTVTFSAQEAPKTDLAQRLKANATIYSSLDRGGDLVKQAADDNKDVTKTLIGNIDEAPCLECLKPVDSNHWRIKETTRESDLVVVGTVSRSISAFTPLRGFIYTDSQFTIEEIWKTNDKTLRLGDEITLTTAGGSLTVDGHRITARVDNTVALNDGDRYLLYLKYFPTSHSYGPANFFGYKLTPTSVSPMSLKVVPPGQDLFGMPGNFLEVIKASTDAAGGAK